GPVPGADPNGDRQSCSATVSTQRRTADDVGRFADRDGALRRGIWAHESAHRWIHGAARGDANERLEPTEPVGRDRRERRYQPGSIRRRGGTAERGPRERLLPGQR